MRADVQDIQQSFEAIIKNQSTATLRHQNTLALISKKNALPFPLVLVDTQAKVPSSSGLVATRFAPHGKSAERCSLDDSSAPVRFRVIAEQTACRLAVDARRLTAELEDLRYLDDLIFMLKGQLERISLRVWPFTMGHVPPGPTTVEEYNLVV
uniref:Uncharacterized protein n=1 Tax=Timema poppense TaxID=170557 RepID=A0A7R9H5G3_TIMPO|nr:unnamed protein product [Timema poppensis]